VTEENNNTEHEAVPGYKTALFVAIAISVGYLILTFIL